MDNGSWSQKTIYTGKDTLYSAQTLQFLDAKTGYAMGYLVNQGLSLCQGYTSVLFKTTDGGNTWQKNISKNYIEQCYLDHYDYKGYNSIYFTDANTGWLMGEAWDSGSYVYYGSALKTTNGGTSWIRQIPPVRSSLHAVHMSDNNTGWALGYGDSIQNPILFKTINGGTVWTSQIIDNNTNFPWDFQFMNGNTGWVVGDKGTILKTTTAGAAWTTESSGTTATLYSVNFVDANKGWAVGYDAVNCLGIILKTLNGGVTWTRQNSGTIFPLVSVFFVDTNTGYAAGGGKALVTTLSKKSSKINSPAKSEGEARVAAAGFGMGFELPKWLEGLNPQSQPEILAMYPGGGGDYGGGISAETPQVSSANSYSEILKTTDGGTHWTTELTKPGAPLRSIHCLSATNCTVTGDSTFWTRH